VAKNTKQRKFPDCQFRRNLAFEKMSALIILFCWWW